MDKRMKKRLLPAFLIIAVYLIIGQSAIIHAQSQKVDADGIKNMITILAGKDYEGRETGTSGCEKAEEYFASEYQKLGLKPLGAHNSFYFPYTFKFERGSI